MSFSMPMPPFIPDPRGIHQPHPVSQGFSGNDRGLGSLAYSIGERRYPGSDPVAYTPQLSSVSGQDYSELRRQRDNELLQSRVQYHHDTYQQSAEPSPAPQSDLRGMFDKAREYFWSQQHQQHQQPHQQQQPPHTRGPSPLEIQRTNALHTLGLSPDSNPTYADVKQAYKKAVLEKHPDKVAGRTEEFIEAIEAYKFLNDNFYNQNGGNMAKTGGNNTIKRRHKKHKLAKKTRGKKHSNRRSKTRGKTYRKTRKNTTKRR